MLDDLVDEGLIRSYGWSTPYLDRVRSFAKGAHCTAIQYNYNILERNPEMLALCKESNQASITRGPYAMGLLTGKYNKSSKMPKDDIRSGWDLQKGHLAKQLEMLDMIREILTRDGRTIAQAAIGWLLALDDQVIPIPGFKSVKQVEDTMETLQFGPLSTKQMFEIEKILEPFSDDLVYFD